MRLDKSYKLLKKIENIGIILKPNSPELKDVYLKIKCLFENKNINILPLKIAGIISDEEGVIVAKKYKELNDIAKTKLGSSLKAPFMTLSFMALLVIPEIKLSDKGLFDVNTFKFISPFLSCN